jgi:NitT/TauT family transport system substrate-binding protein
LASLARWKPRGRRAGRRSTITKHDEIEGSQSMIQFGITRRNLLIAGAASAFGAAPAQAAADMVFITPYGKIIAYTPIFIGIARGYFAKAGVNVDVYGGNGSAQAVQLVAAAKGLVGRTGGIDVVKAIAASSVPVRAIATLCHRSPFLVMSSPDKPIKTPKDMEGKTIGIVSRGGATDNYLDIMLVAVGLNANSVSRQVVGNSPGAFDLLQLGRLDAFIADSSVLIALQKAGKNPYSFAFDDFAAIPAQVYVASEDGIKSHKDELKGFLRGAREAIEFIVAPGNMDAVMEGLQQFHLEELRNPDAARASIDAQSKLWVAEGPENILRNIPAKWAKGWEQMTAAGLVKAGDPTTAYTNDFLAAP